jgi:transcription elongation regulator 1
MDPAVIQGHQPLVYNPALPAGWIEYRTPTGQPYWYNTHTRQSSWVFPVQPSVAAPKNKKQIK